MNVGIINVKRLWAAETITKNTATTSAVVPLLTRAPNGIFSIGITVTGDGTLTLSYTVALHKDATFVTPSDAVAIVEGFVKTSGTGGVDVISFQPEPCAFIKIVATETVTTDDAVITLDLLLQ